MRKAFYIVLFLLILSIIINVLLCVWKKPRFDEERRETIIDTIFYREPVPVDSFVIRYITESVPVFKEDEVKSVDIRHDTIQPVVIMKEDSAQLVIPITQKIYEDSTYRAYVSGYHPSLDSIEILRYTEKVYIHVPAKRQRFSFGLQGGYGYTPKGFQPYIGVGVSVNLCSF